jgi:hypothetical protein
MKAPRSTGRGVLTKVFVKIDEVGYWSELKLEILSAFGVPPSGG